MLNCASKYYVCPENPESGYIEADCEESARRTLNCDHCRECDGPMSCSNPDLRDLIASHSEEKRALGERLKEIAVKCYEIKDYGDKTMRSGACLLLTGKILDVAYELTGEDLPPVEVFTYTTEGRDSHAEI